MLIIDWRVDVDAGGRIIRWRSSVVL